MQYNGLDEKDNEIIRLLCENARLSYSEIGERIQLSRTAVKTRVSDLEEMGIILGYHATSKQTQSILRRQKTISRSFMKRLL